MKNKIIMTILVVGVLTIGCGTIVDSKGFDVTSSSDNIQDTDDKEEKIENNNINSDYEEKGADKQLKDTDEEGVDKMDEIIEKISGNWISEDESIKVEIKHAEKGYWAFIYTTEKDGEQTFGINGVFNAGEEGVPATYNDCDYVLEVASGEFYSYKGIKIQDEKTIVLKERERKEYILFKQE